MLRNTAGQVIAAQMTTISDGTNFTGTVTVYLTLDNGSQTIGSVGSGVCTHKGRGLHVYLPSQAETNASVVRATFTGTGAYTQTQEYETPVTTGDAYARIGSGGAGLTSLGDSRIGNLDAAITTRTKPADTQAAVATVANLANAPTSGDLTTTMKASLATAFAAALNTAQVESYNADGSTASVVQLLYGIFQFLTEMSRSGNTLTVHRLNGSSVAFTLTIDSPTATTAISRTS